MAVDRWILILGMVLLGSGLIVTETGSLIGLVMVFLGSSLRMFRGSASIRSRRTIALTALVIAIAWLVPFGMGIVGDIVASKIDTSLANILEIASSFFLLLVAIGWLVYVVVSNQIQGPRNGDNDGLKFD